MLVCPALSFASGKHFSATMPSSSSSIYHCCLMILFFAVATFSVSSAASSEKPKPNALIFPIRKDSFTGQYYTTLDISRRNNSVQLVLDLGGPHTWFKCDASKIRTFKSIRCGSAECREYNTLDEKCCPLPVTRGCTKKDSCALYSSNPCSQKYVPLGIKEDLLFVKSTNGVSVGLTYQSPKPFPFTCSDVNLLIGLTTKTLGMTGLANTTTSLSTQISTQFNLPHKFALCLPSTSKYAPGHMFIGGGPYHFLPYRNDVAKELIATKLVISHLSTAPVSKSGQPSYEYYAEAKYISVDNKLVTINSSLLSVDKVGNGGLTFSTIYPYTTVMTPIYEALVRDFTKAAELKKMKRVASVEPFGLCFEAKSIAKSQTGPVVPYIDIGLAGKKYWRFYGANSMIPVNKRVSCLAFIDGGKNPTTSVIVGAHQMENYLIEFDLVSSEIGISTSLLSRNTTCSQSRVA